MRRAAILASAVTLSVLAVVPARAQLGASGTRLSVAGSPPRFYMTYGHIEEQELFAPVTVELKRLHLMFLVEGDQCTVLQDGKKLAVWPVVRSREEIPASPEQPFILMLGSTTYVPLKRLAKLTPIDVRWDRRTNMVTVLAGSKKPAVATKPPTSPATPPKASRAPEPQPLDSPVVLKGITLEATQKGVRVRVQAPGALRANTLYLTRPPRVVIDFPNAQWPKDIASPKPVPGVRTVRLGHPTPDQARVVLEVTSPALKVTGVESDAEQTVLSLGTGAPLPPSVLPSKPTEVASEQPPTKPATSALEEQIRAAVARRSTGTVRVAQSRGGLRLPASDLTTSTPATAQVPADNAWQYIVIHHSATPSGNAAAFDAAHRRKKWDGLAYHFVINNGKGNPDGYLEISPRWREQKHGAHAGGLPGGSDPDVRNGFNEFGIGICLVGNFQRSQPTEKQLRTLAALIQALRAEFNIPAENVLGHGSVKGTACPGAAFPWKRLFALMELPPPTHLQRHAILQTTARCPWCQEKETAQ